MIADLFC